MPLYAYPEAMSPMRFDRLCTFLLSLLIVNGLACKRAATPLPSDKAALQPAASDEIRLIFSYGSEKQKWVDDVTAAFNASGAKTASGKHITIETLPKGSGDSSKISSADTDHADLTSPASGVFIKLGNARSRADTGQDLIGNTQRTSSSRP